MQKSFIKTVILITDNVLYLILVHIGQMIFITYKTMAIKND